MSGKKGLAVSKCRHCAVSNIKCNLAVRTEAKEDGEQEQEQEEAQDEDEDEEEEQEVDEDQLDEVEVPSKKRKRSNIRRSARLHKGEDSIDGAESDDQTPLSKKRPRPSNIRNSTYKEKVGIQVSSCSYLTFKQKSPTTSCFPHPSHATTVSLAEDLRIDLEAFKSGNVVELQSEILRLGFVAKRQINTKTALLAEKDTSLGNMAVELGATYAKLAVKDAELEAMARKLQLRDQDMEGLVGKLEGVIEGQRAQREVNKK